MSNEQDNLRQGRGSIEGRADGPMVGNAPYMTFSGPRNVFYWQFWELSFQMAQQDIQAIKGNIRLGNERAARNLARDAATCGLFVIYGSQRQRSARNQ